MTERFLIFLALFFFSLGVHNHVSQNARKWLQLFLSACFALIFGWPTLAAALFFSVFTFYLGQLLNAEKKAIFLFGIGFNLAGIFYFNSSGALRAFSGTSPAGYFDAGNLPLLIGLSFYGLQHVAYLTDIYKGRIQPSSVLSDYILTSLFFPKLLCGPIVLFQKINPQIGVKRIVKENAVAGFNRILFGIFKKLVVADRLAPSVGSVFDYQDTLPGLTVFSGAVIFTLQLYFDFSAYSDMAIGCAKVLGIDLPENFSFPLRATSLTVLWRKWHQTLLQFFTDYVFLPFTFRFRSAGRMAVGVGILLTFLLSGLWHGIGLTFLLWSFCHTI
jgi:D-alanyl-lipoteichoic acid acyltransferase DltB (MBOAT superfamily)